MNNRGVLADWTDFRNNFFMAAGMTDEFEFVAVKSERKKTVGAKSLPAALITNCKRSGTTTIMKNEGLLMLIKVLNNFFNQGIGKISILREGDRVP